MTTDAPGSFMIDRLLAEQSARLRARVVLAYLPRDGVLPPSMAAILERLGDQATIHWVAQGEAQREARPPIEGPIHDWALEAERADQWRTLITASSLRRGQTIPGLARRVGLGRMDWRHLKALGGLAGLRPTQARLLAPLTRLLPGGLGARGAAIRALASYRADPALIPCLRRADHARLEAEFLDGLDGTEAGIDARIEALDPLFTLAPARPDDPLFNELLRSHTRLDRLMAVTVEGAEDILERCGTLFNKPRYMACAGGDADPRRTAVAEAVDMARERVLPMEDVDDWLSDTFIGEGELLRMRRGGKQRTTISHAYRANEILADYCGLDEPVTIHAFWMHGWLPEPHADHPAHIAKHKIMGRSIGPETRDHIEATKNLSAQWVARTDEKDKLVEAGYDHVDVVGLPFCYLPESTVTREPGSLLVMPPHNMVRNADLEAVQGEYAAYIKSIASHFSRILVAVSAKDHWLGIWSRAFAEQGIDVLIGVDGTEPGALMRQKNLLHSVEFMTTSGTGSHIPYAASCGVKVSVAGPRLPFDDRSIHSNFLWRVYPELRPSLSRSFSVDYLEELYPFLFTNPWEAVERVGWGRHQIGADNRLPPEEMRALLDHRSRVPPPLPEDAR